jgi:hypothetical protein
MLYITHILLSYNLDETIAHLSRLSTLAVKPTNVIVVILWSMPRNALYYKNIIQLLQVTALFRDFSISICQNVAINNIVDAFKAIQKLTATYLILGDLFNFCADFVVLNSGYFEYLSSICSEGLISNTEGIIYPAVVGTVEVVLGHDAVGDKTNTTTLKGLTGIDKLKRIRTAIVPITEVFTLFKSTILNKEIPKYIKYNKLGDYLFYTLETSLRNRTNNFVYFDVRTQSTNLKTVWESVLFWWHISVIKGIV